MDERILKAQAALQAVDGVILGKEKITRLAMATLLAGGSLLIQDRPGLGKTTLAKALSRVLGLSFERIQCTNDLLPMDILGRVEGPSLVKGPIFGAIVLLDELNRAPSRTQSALLQAMEEGEVTIEGRTYPLPSPQMFIATQNPDDQVGTSPLPESELDRFTVQLQMGYPVESDEKKILRGFPQEALKNLSEIWSKEELTQARQEVAAVNVSETFLDLVVRFLGYVRSSGAFLSPRAGRDLVRVSQAVAFLQGRDFATPDDFKFCLQAITGHRIEDADGIISRFPFYA